MSEIRATFQVPEDGRGASRICPTISLPKITCVPPIGPSSSLRIFLLSIRLRICSAALAPTNGYAGRSFKITKKALLLPLSDFLPIKRHSPMSVSAENDMLLSSDAEIEIKIRSLYFWARSCREFSQDSPEIRLRGIIKASLPFCFSLRSARTRNIEASPALPCDLLSFVKDLTASAINFCSSALEPKAANIGFGTFRLSPSCLVARVKGGFIITTSKFV